MVERRAQYFKKRFGKDPKYFCYYNKFMEEILSKGYAKISKDTLMEEYGICLIMEGTTQPNPIRFKLFLIAAQNMQEDQSTKN